MWEFLWKGGVLMAPLVLCSIFGTALILDRLYHFIRARWKARTFYEGMTNRVRRRQFDDAAGFARRQSGPVAAEMKEVVSLILEYRPAVTAMVPDAESAVLEDL